MARKVELSADYARNPSNVGSLVLVAVCDAWAASAAMPWRRYFDVDPELSAIERSVARTISAIEDALAERDAA